MQAVGGVRERAAEGVDRGVGAGAHQHPGAGGRERGHQVDPGRGEVLRVIDHDGAEGRRGRGIRQEAHGAAHESTGVQAGPGVQGGGGLEVQHAEVVAQDRRGVRPGRPAAFVPELLEIGRGEPQLGGAGDEVAQLGAEARQRAGAGVDLEVPGLALRDQLGQQGVLLGAGDQGRLAQAAAQRVGAHQRVAEGRRGHRPRLARAVHGERVAQPAGGGAAGRQQQRALPGPLGRGEGEGGAAAAGPAVDEHVAAGEEPVQGAPLGGIEILGREQGGQRLEVGSEQADALPRDVARRSHAPIPPHR